MMRHNKLCFLSVLITIVFFLTGIMLTACDSGENSVPGYNAGYGCDETSDASSDQPTDSSADDNTDSSSDYSSTDTSTDDTTDTSSSYDAVVAQDGSGDYLSVQSAINAAPDNGDDWYTIYIKDGNYYEVITVPSEKTYLRLVGESADGTILTYDNCSSTAGGTSNSASVFLKAENFIAKNVTFENSFDYNNSSLPNKQAVAAEPMADRQVFVNCRFTGYQDTLYVKNNARAYFKDCYIQGHTDFIFGDSTAVFDNCQIDSRDKNGGCITAPSTLATTSYGLVFLNCNITGNSTGVWLGRPWHPSSSTDYIQSMAAYINCNLDSHIADTGWTSMGDTQPETERFYEYNNSGDGAAVNSSRPQLSDSEADQYTVENILGGSDSWDPESWADM
jgi:pectinesterase